MDRTRIILRTGSGIDSVLPYIQNQELPGLIIDGRPCFFYIGGDKYMVFPFFRLPEGSQNAILGFLNSHVIKHRELKLESEAVVLNRQSACQFELEYMPDVGIVGAVWSGCVECMLPVEFDEKVIPFASEEALPSVPYGRFF